MIDNLKFVYGTFVILLLFPIACAGAHMQTGNSGLPSEYFPLKAGLYWKYRYTGLPRQPVDVDVRITDAKEINGKSYFRLSTWFTLTQSVPSREVWVSWHDGSIYIYDGKTEILAIGAGIEQSELRKNDPATPVETPAGKFTDVFRFRDCLRCADAGSQFHFAREKGIVLVTMTAIWGGAQYELLETNAP